MNYAAFERMQTGALSRLENEPEQDYMTRVFREICRCDGFCGPDTPCSEHRINDMLAPTLIACSAEALMQRYPARCRGSGRGICCDSLCLTVPSSGSGGA